jgi:hypothetical protein
VSAGGASLVVESAPAGFRRVFSVEGQRLVWMQQAATVPVISTDGRYAAWETPLLQTEGVPLHQARLVLWDLSTMRQVGSTVFRSHQQCCDAPSLPVGIDHHTAVYVWDGGVPLVWSPRESTVRRITGLPQGDDLVDAYAGGPVFGGGNKEQPASVFGPIDAGDAFRPAGSFGSQQGSWSPSSAPHGERVAYVTGYGRPRVSSATGHQPTVMRLPEGDYTPSVWESAHTVLFTSDVGGDIDWIRCSADTGRCQMALVLRGAAGDVELPEPG